MTIFLSQGSQKKHGESTANHSEDTLKRGEGTPKRGDGTTKHGDGTTKRGDGTAKRKRSEDEIKSKPWRSEARECVEVERNLKPMWK